MNVIDKLQGWIVGLAQYKNTQNGLHRNSQVKSLKKSISIASELISLNDPGYFSAQIDSDSFYHQIPTTDRFIGEDVLKLESVLIKLMAGLQECCGNEHPYRSKQSIDILHSLRDQYDWLLFIDLEYNQHKLKTGSSEKIRESIVEFGLVALRSDDLESGFELDTLLLPYPEIEIGKYCHRITGITTEMLQGKPRIDDFYNSALKPFLDREEKCLFIHWGGREKQMLYNELASHGKHPKKHNFIDLQSVYKQMHGEDTMGLLRAVENLGIGTNLKAHRAVNDARYIAKIYKILLSGN